METENQVIPAEQNNVQNGLNMLGSGNEQSEMLSNLLKSPELLSIILDMVGSNLAPDNPFAGVGSSLAKSSLAAKAEEERAEGFDGIVKGLLGQMTGADKAGPTALTITGDPATGYQYNVKGFESGQKKMEETTDPIIRSSEDFIKDFGGGI